MHLIVTAGPTREYIDSVRFLSNPSSGYMGCAVAREALDGGHGVTLLISQWLIPHLPPALTSGASVVPFTTAEDLLCELSDRFDNCDALVMAAAVGDFRAAEPVRGKLSRSAGPIKVRLVPTEDVVAAVAANKRDDQTIVTFAVEDGPIDQMEAKARSEMATKKAHYVVVNTPAAMGFPESRACILSATDVVLPWAARPKEVLAKEILALLHGRP